MAADLLVEWNSGNDQSARDNVTYHGCEGQGGGCVDLVRVDDVHVRGIEDVDEPEAEECCGKYGTPD